MALKTGPKAAKHVPSMARDSDDSVAWEFSTVYGMMGRRSTSRRLRMRNSLIILGHLLSEASFRAISVTFEGQYSGA